VDRLTKRKLESPARKPANWIGKLVQELDLLPQTRRRPKLRAERTAVLACEALGTEPEGAAELRGGPFDSLSLTTGRGDVLLVGHEPDFSSEIARLTGARVKLRKGGLAIVDGSTLLALLRPGDLSSLAERSAS
jgi:phosphohistidine phosphatase